MTLDTLAKIGEFVGGAVVVVSLLYLALQARQSAQAQRSENFGRTVDRVATILARLEDSAELTELVAIGSADPSAFIYLTTCRQVYKRRSFRRYAR